MTPGIAAPQLKGGVSGEVAAGRRTLTALQIADLVGGRLVGDAAASVDHVAPIERAGPAALTFLASARYASALASCEAPVVLMSEAFHDLPGSGAARVVVPSPYEAMLLVLPHLYQAPKAIPHVDATVRIGRGARIGQGVILGPYVIIGDGAAIGDRVRIDAHAVVGDGVVVGADTHLLPHVTLFPGTTLGDRVVVHAGARVGSDGFGYVFGAGAHQKIPHVGRCVVESDVEIGANTTIDRGSIDDTVIGAGTKIDNLVHVAHNVRIGRLCLIMAHVGISGSVRVGDGCVLAGQVGVAGHVSIGDGARVAAQAGVFGDIPAGETWSGYPARPHSQSLRATAALFKLSGMIRQLEKFVSGRS